MHKRAEMGFGLLPQMIQLLHIQGHLTEVWCNTRLASLSSRNLTVPLHSRPAAHPFCITLDLHTKPVSSAWQYRIAGNAQYRTRIKNVWPLMTVHLYLYCFPPLWILVILWILKALRNVCHPRSEAENDSFISMASHLSPFHVNDKINDFISFKKKKTYTLYHLERKQSLHKLSLETKPLFFLLAFNQVKM